MPGPELLLSSLIDVDEWNRASWLGVAYLNPYGSPVRPGVGLLFENRAAAVNIFTAWQQRIGPRDRHEELRVSVIEGDIKGQDPGYSVYLTSNVDRIIERAKAEGLSTDGLRIATLGRIHRLGDSGTLPQFRRHLADAGGVYEILPVIVGSGRQLDPLMNLAIEKRQILFRNVSEITDPNDLDGVMIGRRPGN